MLDRYCIPMDKLGRAIQRQEEVFFSEFDTGNIPVIVLFTKFDALLVVAMSKLTGEDRRLPLEERKAKAHSLIDGIFENANIMGRLCGLNHAPKYSVQLGGMHNSNAGCNVLLETTASALNEETLQLLLLSAQQANIAHCIHYAAQDMVNVVNGMNESPLPLHNMNNIEPQRLARWFPHFLFVSFIFHLSTMIICNTTMLINGCLWYLGT